MEYPKKKNCEDAEQLTQAWSAIWLVLRCRALLWATFFFKVYSTNIDKNIVPSSVLEAVESFIGLGRIVCGPIILFLLVLKLLF
jgi:hypothetical protein